MNPDIRVGGSWHSITRGELYRGGSWRTLTRGEIYKGGAWHALFTFVLPMTALASPPSAFGDGGSKHGVTVTSGSVTVTPTGGLGPYTYDWTGSDVSVSFPHSATTNFSAFVLSEAEVDGFASCTVTDSLGVTAATGVSVTLVNNP